MSIDFKALSEEYNEKRKQLPFITVAASENCIKSLFNIHPELKELEGDELIKAIGWQIHLLSFW